MKTRLVIGKVGAVYGVHGWIKIHSYTDPGSNILDYQPWQLELDNTWQTYNIAESRIQANNIVVRFADITDREAAKVLTNAPIAVARTQLPTLAAGEYYWSDLTGLAVINQANITLGKVDYLFATPANDVMVVIGEREHLIPFILNEVIIEVDLEQNVIRVNWDADF